MESCAVGLAGRVVGDELGDERGEERVNGLGDECGDECGDAGEVEVMEPGSHELTWDGGVLEFRIDYAGDYSAQVGAAFEAAQAFGWPRCWDCVEEWDGEVLRIAYVRRPHWRGSDGREPHVRGPHGHSGELQ